MTACPACMLGDGDKCIEIVYGEEKKQPRKDTYHLYSLSPHLPVSTVSRGHPSLVSLE